MSYDPSVHEDGKGFGTNKMMQTIGGMEADDNTKNKLFQVGPNGEIFAISSGGLVSTAQILNIAAITTIGASYEDIGNEIIIPAQARSMLIRLPIVKADSTIFEFQLEFGYATGVTPDREHLTLGDQITRKQRTHKILVVDLDNVNGIFVFKALVEDYTFGQLQGKFTTGGTAGDVSIGATARFFG